MFFENTMNFGIHEHIKILTDVDAVTALNSIMPQPLELHLTSELLFAQKQEGILPELLSIVVVLCSFL